MAKWLVTDTKSDWMTCWLTFPWRAEWPTKKMTCFCFKLVLEWQHERLMAWLNDFTIDCLYDVLSYFFSEFLLSAQSFLRASELKPSLSLYLKLPLLWDTSLVSFVLPEPTPLSAPSSPKYLKLFLTPWLSISPTFLPTVLLWGGQTIGFCQQPPLEPNLPSSRNRSSFRHSRGMLTFLGLGDMGHHSYKQFFRNNCGIHSIATSHSLVRYSAQ